MECNLLKVGTPPKMPLIALHMRDSGRKEARRSKGGDMAYSHPVRCPPGSIGVMANPTGRYDVF